MNLSRSITPLAAVLLLAGSLSAQLPTTETFETYTGLGSGAVNLNVLSLDDNTIANGQGPGLVLDGCTYSCNSNTMQWDGAGYFGSTSQNILANTFDGLLRLTYDTPVSSMSVDLMAFAGYPDSTIITVYNASNVVIFTSGAISVPGATAVPFSYSAASIGMVEIDSQVYSWSTLIDNHVFGGTSFTLAKSGTCPGPVTLSTSNGTPNTNVAYIYGNAGTKTKPGGVCAGTTVNISNPKKLAIASGNGAGNSSFSFNASPALCGKTVQAVLVGPGPCTVSNTIVL